MTRTYLFTLLTLGFFLAPVARAQVAKGLNEVNASASFTSTEGATFFQVSGFFGHFISSRFEIGPRLAYTKFEGSDGIGSVGAFGTYHFGRTAATTVPFAGARLDLSFGRGDSSVSVGGFGGAKFFLNPGAAITTQVFATVGDFTTVGAVAGVSIFF